MADCDRSAKICSLCDDIKYLCGENGAVLEVINKANEIIKIMVESHQAGIEPVINEFGEAFCGNCGENIGIIGQTINVRVRMRYCPECGQKANWTKWNKYRCHGETEI